MKRTILLIAIAFSLSAITISCKENQENKENNTEHAAEKADIAMNDIYQCPMDCEDGKTYDEEGDCPVCKMKLKKVEDKKEEEGHEGHNH